jgi:N-acetylglutamate synthase-like GNAT family acetyltransferase
MDIRPYTSADRDACLDLFDSHFPAPSCPDFAAFLASPAGLFFVLDHESCIVGCGGYTLDGSPGAATLVWVMVRPDLQRQGLGRYLLMYCLRQIGNLGGIDRVVVDAPPTAVRFFERQGFRPFSVQPDHVQLQKKLTVCT